MDKTKRIFIFCVMLPLLGLTLWFLTGVEAARYRSEPHWQESQRAFFAGDYAVFNEEAHKWKASPRFCPLIVTCR